MLDSLCPRGVRPWCISGSSFLALALLASCDRRPGADPIIVPLAPLAPPAPAGPRIVHGVPTSPTRVAVRRFDELLSPGGQSRPDQREVDPPEVLPVDPVAALRAAATQGTAALPTPTMPSPALSASFVGAPSAGLPPDTMGAVGPNHLLVTLNGLVQIESKTGQVLSATSLGGFFQSVAPGGASSDVFDPSALYDPLGGRFVVICMAQRQSPQSSVLMAVSQSSDPTAGWFFFAFDIDPADVGWADFGKLGVNKNWVFTHTPMNDTTKSQMLVCDKAALYAGTASCTGFAPTEMRSRPVISYDPGADTAYFLRLVTVPFDGRVAIDTVTGPVGSEVFTMNAFTLTLPESFATQGGEMMPQLNSTTKMWADPGGNVSSLVLRDGSFWGTMTACLPLPAPTRCGIRWFQATPTGTLQQYGGIDDLSGVNHSTYATMAVNKNHDLLIGFSRFSAEQYAAAAYAFRAGGDPANTLRGDAVYRPGQNTYGFIRWGDYTVTAVDPSNDLDLWTLQEFSFGAGFDYNLQWGRVTPPGPSAVTTIAPVADAYVQDGTSASTNFGAATTLQVKATSSTGTNRWAYLRFPLSTVGGAVTTARLRLHGSRPTANGIPDLVYSVSSNTWTESGITFNNKPPVGTAQDFGVAIHSNAHDYEWDVTPFVKAQKAAGATAVSLAVRMSANVTIAPDTFSSREAAANRPELVVVFDSVADAPPFVVQAAAATPNPVSGTTTTLSVLGGDDHGEPALKYTWSGPAGVTFSANGSNAAKNVTATFGGPGTYNLTATIRDASDQTATSSVNVTVTSGGTTTLSPVADAHVRDGTSAGTNFGTATALEQKNSTTAGNNRRTFLRFAIDGLGSTIGSATLRLDGSSVTSAKLIGVYAVGDTSWGETTITFNNAPTIGAKQGASKSVGLTAAYVEWDVTGYLQAQKTAGATAVSFEVKQDVANNEGPTTFASREAASNRPQLVVSATGGGDTPPIIVEPAAATPNPVMGTTAALSVLGDDDHGEPALTYTWSSTGPAAVGFSANGTNAAKNVTATFSTPGSYTLTATVRDASDQTVTSSVPVMVSSGSSTVTLPAEADAHVRDGTSAGSNFGTATALEQKNSTVAGNVRRTFVRFPIGSVGSTVTAATLKLSGSSVTSAKLVGVYAVASTTWGESTITFNNAPTIGAKQGGSQSVGLTAAQVSWDVTSYLQAQKTAGATAVTFELKQDVANNEGPTTFSSREASSNQPSLVVTSN